MKFTYAFQPIFDVQANKIFSYEALIRGCNNESPLHIYSQIEKEKWPDFDQQARNVAIKLAAKLGLQCHLNLNFIADCLQFSHDYILETIKIFTASGFKTNQLIIEILEADIIHDHVAFAQLINHFRGQGVKVAIDDFGAGYSGLNLLVNFQPDIIKLDMQLIRGIESNGPRQAIVKALVQICTSLGIDIIAEGVETREEVLWLNEQGIYLFQGYLFAKPGFECFPTVNDPLKL